MKSSFAMLVVASVGADECKIDEMSALQGSARVEVKKHHQEVCRSVEVGQKAPIDGVFTANDGSKVTYRATRGEVAQSAGRFCVDEPTVALLQRAFSVSDVSDFDVLVQKKQTTTEEGSTEATASTEATVSGKSGTTADTTAAPELQAIASKVLLVGLYENPGSSVSVESYAVDGNSLSFIGGYDAGSAATWFTQTESRAGDVASLFAVSESGDTVASLNLFCDGSLKVTSRVSSQGAGPVHLAVDSTEEHLLVANYGGGTLSVLPINRGENNAALLGEATQTLDFGSNANVHSVYLTGSGENGQYSAFVPTLGLDEVQQLTYQNGILTDQGPYAVGKADGPRHLAFNPQGNLAVLVLEGRSQGFEANDKTIQLLEVSPGAALRNIQTLSALPSDMPSVDLFSSEVMWTHDAKFVLISVRDETDQKRDGISVYKLCGEKELCFVGYTIVGHYPRSIALTDDNMLIVGNQKDNDLTFLQFDEEMGTLIKAADNLKVSGKPAFVGLFDTADGCANKDSAVLV